MKVISFQSIEELHIDPVEAYRWATEMIACKENALMPAKISMKPSDGVFCNVMPSIVSDGQGGLWGGVKAVTRYPHRIPSLDSKILLYDANNGDFLCIIDANWITAMRTGAVAAHSIQLFAKTDFKTIGLVGLGNSARATIHVLAKVQPEREIRLRLLKYKEQELDFVKRFRNYENLTFSFVDSAEDLVKGSDVVVSAATYLPNDIASDNCFDEGILVVPIHTLGFTNCDLFFDKVFADDRDHVSNFRYFDKFKSFAEVSDVVNGKATGRENDRERILAYNIGISMHDINFASHIYQMIQDADLPTIDLKEPKEKFWI